MRKSIFWKFMTAYLIFALLGFFTINFTTTRQTYSHLESTYAITLYNGAKSISNDIAKSTSVLNPSTYETSIHSFSESLGCAVWIVDSDLNVVYSYGDTDVPEKIPDNCRKYFGTSYYKVGKFGNLFTNKVLSVYKPIIMQNETVGYVLVHMPSAKILYSTLKIVDIFYFSYFIILFFSMLLIFSFIIYYYIPLKAMRKATLEYANGNFSYDKLKIHTNDEIGDLASSLVYMAHQLNDAEEYQKKFVSNISHDFRSPLTSIKGYVEAIIDGTIPYELQNKYLNIVLSEAERLESLTNGLIDLNTWGGKKPGLIIEDFDIDLVIISILETFEGRCEKKGVSVKFDPKKDHIVKADKGKIQQVLYNLIDNAIKFSPSGSEINIRVYTKGDKIFCSIKDAGIGISKDEINRIWDRFYKTDSSRGKDKTGSGIGLAIVREIINAHNQTIDVVSTEGVGTEFIFSLDRCKIKKRL